MTRRLMWVGFLLRVMVAAWNAFVGPTIGADGDAIGLHDMAVSISRGQGPATFHLGYLYAYVLGAAYRVIVPSLFLGGVLSCLVWLASARTLIATMDLLQLARAQQARAMLVYSLLPSSIFWTSITIREPYQLVAVNLAAYAALKIYLSQSYRYSLLLVGASTIGGLMHGAIFGWGVLLVVATAASMLFRRRHVITPWRLAVAVPCALVFLWLGYRTFTTFYQYPLDRGLAYAVESYQRGGLSIGVRTDYRSTVTIEDTFDLLLFIPGCLLQYLFEPLPWRMSAFVDIEPVMENILRAVLIWTALITLFRCSFRARRPLLLVLFSYVLLETAFSLGTFNWGTAARHHIPATGLLLLLAFAGPPRTPSAVATHPAGAAGSLVAA